MVKDRRENHERQKQQSGEQHEQHDPDEPTGVPFGIGIWSFDGLIIERFSAHF
jgi:hypothetical protein